MRIRHGEGGTTLDLCSGGGVQSCINVGITLFAFVFACLIGGTIFWGHYQSEHMPTPWWILAVPFLFLGIGVLIVGGNQRIRAHLARYGHSSATTSRWLGLQKDEQSFEAAAVHHLHLHTEERITRNKNGTTRSRISHLAAVLRDGTEVLIGRQRRGGLGGQQPLLEQAGEIALFLGVPLERTGLGAPIGYGFPPSGTAGPPPGPGGWDSPPYGHSTPPQSYGYPLQQYPPGPSQGFRPGGPGPQGGQYPGDGGGLPSWIRGKGQ